MTMLRIWVLVLVLFALTFLALLRAGVWSSSDLEISLPPRDADIPIAAIGTSLMGRGMQINAGLLGQKPDTMRLAQSNMPTDRALRVATQSLENGAKLLIIEAQPFLRTLKPNRQLDGNWAHPMRHLNRSLDRTFAQKLRWRLWHVLILGKDANRLTWIQDSETEPIGYVLVDLQRLYPPHLIETPYQDQLAGLTQTAAELDAQILFVAMPISDTAARYLGDVYRLEFEAHIQRFAQQNGVKVWTPGFSWPDIFFYDNAHMNEEGRLRFTETLSAFLTDAL